MRRPLGTGRVGGAPWLPISGKGQCRVLRQLLDPKGGRGPRVWAMRVLCFPLRLGALWLQSSKLGEGVAYKLPSPPPGSHGSICGNSWEGLGPGIITGPKSLEMRKRAEHRQQGGGGEDQGKSKVGRGRGEGRLQNSERSWAQPIPAPPHRCGHWTKWSSEWHSPQSREGREKMSSVSLRAGAHARAHRQTDAAVPARGPGRGSKGRRRLRL